MSGSKQVGGDHYVAEYQHWDFVADTRMGYLEGCASKYVSRWKNKGKPLEDLQKARSYICKMKELWSSGRYVNNSWCNKGNSGIHAIAYDSYVKFCSANAIAGDEADICYRLLTWHDMTSLTQLEALIDGLIVECKEALTDPVTDGQGNGPQNASTDAPEASHSAASGTRVQQPTTSTSVEQPFGFESKREL